MIKLVVIGLLAVWGQTVNVQGGKYLGFFFFFIGVCVCV